MLLIGVIYASWQKHGYKDEHTYVLGIIARGSSSPVYDREYKVGEHSASETPAPTA